jgi:hypothetical protein
MPSPLRTGPAVDQLRAALDAAFEALRRQHTDLDFDHVQLRTNVINLDTRGVIVGDLEKEALTAIRIDGDSIINAIAIWRGFSPTIDGF